MKRPKMVKAGSSTKEHWYMFCPICLLSCTLLVGYSAMVTRNRADDGSPSANKKKCDPPDLKWGLSEHKQNTMTAALYTPYHLVPGGGERYLLTFAKSMQSMAYKVSIFVDPGNPVTTREGVAKLAEVMGIQLQPVEVYFRHLSPWNSNKFGVFMSLGNSKFPQVRGIGHVNIYMCQFPFDLARPATPSELQNWQTYDRVIVNSRFTYTWYNKVVTKTVQIRDLHIFPEIQVVYPPVPQLSMHESRRFDKSDHSIVLLGRFFAGRQSKGHFDAIRIFDQVQSILVDKTVSLTLAGSQMQDSEHWAYTESLRMKSRGKNVHFLVDYTDLELRQLLLTADILWHLTGISHHAFDPASEEHFGISVALAMSAGVIPVVFDGGAMSEIIDDGLNGYRCETRECIAQKSAHILSLSHVQRQRMRDSCAQKSQEFAESKFHSRVRVIISRSIATKPFRYLVEQTASIVNGRTFNLKPRPSNSIVLIESRNHYAMEYVMKNALYHLGTQWGAILVHGHVNRKYAVSLQKTIQNLIAVNIDRDNIDIPYLNQLLTSKRFLSNFEHYDRLLFIQTDGLILHEGIGPFLKYDFIGAPWHKDNERWGKLQEMLPQGVGNGGMSLRSPRSLLRILEQFDSHGQEDLFYAMKMSGDRRFRLPSRQAAYEFSREVPCHDLSQEKLPVMVHAPWYYFPRDSLYQMLQVSVCGLNTTSKVLI